jgi:hypothetical protein
VAFGHDPNPMAKPLPTHTRTSGAYRVMGASRRGWAVTCECGWRSPLHETEEAAQAAALSHLAEPPLPPPNRSMRKRMPKWLGWPADRRH